MGQIEHIVDKGTGIVNDRADLVVRGVRCAGCVSKIERELAGLPGITSARVNLSTSRLHVGWKPETLDIQSIISRLSDIGFPSSPYEVSEVEQQSKAELSLLLRCLAVAGFAVMNVMLLSISVWSSGGEMHASTQSLLHWFSALIAIPAVIYSGRPFFKSAFLALTNKQANMDVPISLAICLAIGLSLYETLAGNAHTYFDAAVMLVFFLLIGRYLDALMRHKSGEAARSLAALQVPMATRLNPDGSTVEIPGSRIKVGDVIIISSGKTVPVDGVINDGITQLDAKIVSGESRPIAAAKGDPVYSGMINLGHPITIEAKSVQDDSFLTEISRLVEAGQQSKSRYIRMADHAARAYVPIVHSLAVLTFAGWLMAGSDLRHALICAIAVLIITCPCALGLAVPAVNIVSSGRLFSKGVLIRSGDVLEKLSKVNIAVFDKTGTLTTGEPVLKNAVDIHPESLAAAIAIARHSQHPYSKAIAGLETSFVAGNVQEIAGEGVCGKVNGMPVRLGTKRFVDSQTGSNVTLGTWVSYGNNPAQQLNFEDCVRPEAASVIKTLSDKHITSQIMSGDSSEITVELANKVGITVAQGDLKPDQKLRLIKDLETDGNFVLMVGDGINDAPSLARAFVSASLASGSDVAQSTADIILQHDSLAALPDVIDLSKKAQKRIKENIALSVGYNMLAIPLAVIGLVSPLIAALAMSGSSLLVTLNAMRMRAS